MSEDRTPEPGPGEQPKKRAKRFLGRLRRRLLTLPALAVLAVCATLGAAGGALYGLLTPPQYAATAYVLAVPGTGGDSASALGFAQAYGKVATQVAVLGDAQIEAGVPVATLRSSVTAETSPDAPMVAITATARSGGAAADIANAVSGSLVTAAGHSADATRVTLLAFSRAVAPSTPATPGTLLTSAVGACAGGLLGALGLLVRPRRARAGDPRGVPAGAVPAPTQGGGAPEAADTGRATAAAGGKRAR
ncbi:lipopolysaccharide biosynthesis protein [Streptomyces sp. NPDC007088]|uniref:lipopolysaccharide biosynthesis protein n=1 Tax=Streptomyces sp. NPDC007088 TaxID=3364773 RepID=UPI0036BF88AF